MIELTTNATTNNMLITVSLLQSGSLYVANMFHTSISSSDYSSIKTYLATNCGYTNNATVDLTYTISETGSVTQFTFTQASGTFPGTAGGSFTLNDIIIWNIKTPIKTIHKRVRIMPNLPDTAYGIWKPTNIRQDDYFYDTSNTQQTANHTFYQKLRTNMQANYSSYDHAAFALSPVQGPFEVIFFLNGTSKHAGQVNMDYDPTHPYQPAHFNEGSSLPPNTAFSHLQTFIYGKFQFSIVWKSNNTANISDWVGSSSNGNANEYPDGNHSSGNYQTGSLSQSHQRYTWPALNSSVKNDYFHASGGDIAFLQHDEFECLYFKMEVTEDNQFLTWRKKKRDDPHWIPMSKQDLSSTNLGTNKYIPVIRCQGDYRGNMNTLRLLSFKGRLA